jgi:hypothetical protein
MCDVNQLQFLNQIRVYISKTSIYVDWTSFAFRYFPYIFGTIRRQDARRTKLPALMELRTRPDLYDSTRWENRAVHMDR